MKAQQLVAKQTEDFLYQTLETELGGVEIYRMALLCVKNEELKEEWTKYLAQTERHVEVVRGVFDALGLDPEATTPGRQIVRDKGKALLSAMQKALKDAPLAAELVAAECIVDAETKDHGNWHLIGALAENATGATKKVLTNAYDEVEDEEDEHLYHTKGWCRELWMEALGLPAVLPPLEEKRDVKTAVEAGRAAAESKSAKKKKSNARDDKNLMLSRYGTSTFTILFTFFTPRAAIHSSAGAEMARSPRSILYAQLLLASRLR